MNDTLNVISARRSIRNFLDQQVPEDSLDKVLTSVRWSPSWANTQCWELIVIKELSVKEKLQATITPKNPATKAMTNAPVVLAVCGRLKEAGYYKGMATTKFDDWFMFDLGIATQSICLSAHAQGLGTVIVGSFDHSAAGKILNVPKNVEVLVLIPLGFPSKTPKAPKRKEIAEFVHHESF